MLKKREIAVIALYDDKGRILLQDRRDISKAGEQWGFFGGSIEHKETPESALIREIQEELGFKLKRFELLTKYKVLLPDKKLYNDVWLFVGPLDNKPQIITPKEGRGMKLFTINEAQKLTMSLTNIDIIQLIQQYLADKITNK